MSFRTCPLPASSTPWPSHSPSPPPFNKDDAVAPAVVLWTDEKREWEALVPRFRQALPNFFIFGPYNAANRTGPAIWLRCVMSGKVAEISWPPTAVPILYLPGLSRVTLRATEE